MLAIGASVVVAVVMAPRIAETKRHNAVTERREHAKALRAQRAGIVERQRPRAASPGPRDAGPRTPHATRLARRAALVRAIPGAVRHDSETRPHATPVRRVECSDAPGPDPVTDLRATRGRYACTAVTSDVANAGSSGRGVIGYPYRVVLDFKRGRITMCQVAGQAAEGTFVRNTRVPLSPRCG